MVDPKKGGAGFGAEQVFARQCSVPAVGVQSAADIVESTGFYRVFLLY
jgi:hypothetical protein